MSLISCEIDFGDGGEFTIKQRDYLRSYVGVSNNPYDTPLSISRDRLAPKAGTRDRFDFGAWITDVSCDRRDGSLYVWDIQAKSTTEFDEDESENPLDMPAKYTLSSEQVVSTTRKNAKGEWIKNAVGTVIPLEKLESNWTFSVEKNVRSIGTGILDMNETINSSSVFIKGLLIPKHKLKISGLRGEEQTAVVRDQRIEYLTVHFDLNYRKDGWKVKYPNVDLVQYAKAKAVPKRDTNGRIVKVNGVVQYEAIAKTRVPILDDEGNPVTEPWPLDKNGYALPRNFKETDLVEYEEEIYTAKSFSNLPLV